MEDSADIIILMALPVIIFSIMMLGIIVTDPRINIDFKPLFRGIIAIALLAVNLKIYKKIINRISIRR